MILIAPYAKKLRNGLQNPKDYPWWPELIQRLESKGLLIVQVGVEGEKQLVQDFRTNLSLVALGDLVQKCSFWISVDSFFQHFAWDCGKPGFVIWGPSDPRIFGHKENYNIWTGGKDCIDYQFGLWENVALNNNRFPKVGKVISEINQEIFHTHYQGTFPPL